MNEEQAVDREVDRDDEGQVDLVPEVKVVGVEQFATDDELQEYRKTATVFARQLDYHFAVNTMEGQMRGGPGDYVVRANTPAGEVWVIKKAIFEDTYEHVGSAGDADDQTAAQVDPAHPVANDPAIVSAPHLGGEPTAADTAGPTSIPTEVNSADVAATGDAGRHETADQPLIQEGESEKVSPPEAAVTDEPVAPEYPEVPEHGANAPAEPAPPTANEADGSQPQGF